MAVNNYVENKDKDLSLYEKCEKYNFIKSICKIYKDVSLTEWPVEDHWSFSKHKDSDQV